MLKSFFFFKPRYISVPCVGMFKYGFISLTVCVCPQVNSYARGGVRFVGSVLQQAGGGGCDGRVSNPRRGCRSPPRTPPRTPPGDADLEGRDYSPGDMFF